MTQSVTSYPAIYDPHTQELRSKSENKRDFKAQELLFGLIDLYISSGKPIGSQTLKLQGFAHLSSATIRNYFAWLDKEGLLEQIHTSGGRIPTDKAWRRYYDQCSEQPITSDQLKLLEEQFKLATAGSRSLALNDYLSFICDTLARWSGCACFLLTPHFENDHLTHVKIWPFQVDRWVVVTRTQMGFFNHELIALHSSTEDVRVTHIEQCLEKKIYDPLAQFNDLSENEHAILTQLYNESMVRFLLQHTHSKERIWLRSGLSNLLNYSELAHTDSLAQSLHFFEHRRSKEKLLQLMQTGKSTQVWVGQEMQKLFCTSQESSLVATPFFVHQQMVGLIGIVGPRRIPYIKFRQTLEHVSHLISHHLTREYYVFKLGYEAKLTSPRREKKETKE